MLKDVIVEDLTSIELLARLKEIERNLVEVKHWHQFLQKQLGVEQFKLDLLEHYKKEVVHAMNGEYEEVRSMRQAREAEGKSHPDFDGNFSRFGRSDFSNIKTPKA